MKRSLAPWMVFASTVTLFAAGCGTSTHSSTASAGPVVTDAPVTAQPPDDGCAIAARTLDATASTATTDALQLVLDGREAPLPLPGHDRPITSIQRYSTPDDYVANNAGIPDPDTRVEVMRRDGFRAGADVALRVGRDEYYVSVLEFASPAAAADFARYHAFPICSGASDIQPIEGVSHGIAYNKVFEGEPPIAKAVFVAGADEISLAICPCVATSDGVALASQWARDVAHQLGVS